MMDTYKYQQMTLKNRIVRAATNDYCGNENGTISQEQLLRYGRLAKSGIGLLITGNFYISEDGKLDWTQNAIDENFDRNGAEKLVRIVHGHGSRIVFQISHAGRKTKLSELISQKYDKPELLTDERIRQISKMFAAAALRAVQAGADGVQIHFGHGYLLSQLLTERADGIAIEKQILETVKKEVGNFPVLVKVNTDIREEILQQFCKVCEENGVWAIELSGSDFPNKKSTEHLYYLSAVRKCRDVCRVPIILTGGIRNSEDIQEALRQGAALLGMSRPFIRNPELMKVFEEQGSACISCNQCFRIYQKEKRHCVFHMEGEIYEGESIRNSAGDGNRRHDK